MPKQEVSLRSFITAPEFDILGFLPNFGAVVSLVLLIDILMLLFTHIKTIRIVLRLLQGFAVEDIEIKDSQSDLEDAKRRCNLFACCCGCIYLWIDKCNQCSKKFKTVVLKVAKIAFGTFMAQLVIAIFIVAVYFLASVVAALLTMQAVRENCAPHTAVDCLFVFSSMVWVCSI